MNKSRLIVLGIAGAVILSVTQFPFAATMQTRTDYAAALDRAHNAYRNARGLCAPLAGHEWDMCIAEAHALEKRAEAAAEINYKGTIKSKADGRIANADADLMIARIACDSRTGQARGICVKLAKATNVRLVAVASEN